MYIYLFVVDMPVVGAQKVPYVARPKSRFHLVPFLSENDLTVSGQRIHKAIYTKCLVTEITLLKSRFLKKRKYVQTRDHQGPHTNTNWH